VSESPIAVCGLAARFPGAPDADAYWDLLRAGRSGLSRLGAGELREVPRRLREHPRFVPVAGRIDGQADFDPDPFGLTDAEAALLDPQHRLFLECAWHALEHAGHGGGRHAGSVGVFAGSTQSAYLASNLAGRWDPTGGGLDPLGSLQTAIATQPDYLPLQVAYRLDLTGPAVAVATSCSTSLVAVHLAAQSLATGECDTALAGGVSLIVPQGHGYVHVPDGVFAADGVVRPFAEGGTGVVYTQGVGAVVLRRLDDALSAGDPVLAVLHGSATNNDGSGKAGFTAPSVRGQARVVAEALAMAGASPRDVGLVEAHGTATRLGDPIEVAALRKVFGGTGPPWCGLGSVKGSIGHANSAAGIASLIKAVLAVAHRTLPASLHAHPLNPNLALDGSPFAVVDTTRPWDTPPLAGVSSFGIGGTNCHVVIGPAPERAPAAHDPRPQLLVVSGATAEAARATATAVAAAVARPAAAGDDAEPTGPTAPAQTTAPAPHTTPTEVAEPTDPADLAHTLATGRAALRFRVAGVGAGVAAGAAVDANGPVPRVVFAFPGAGGHYAGMGAALYRDEPVFAGSVDATARLLAPLIGADVRESFTTGDARWVRDVAFAVPALYAVSLGTARLLASWGVAPDVVLGHSLGECTAAVVTGALGEADGARLVAARCVAAGRAAGGGAMLAVPLDPESLGARLAGHGELDLAAVNGPGACLVSGPAAAVEALAAELRAEGLQATALRLDAAMHSRRIEPALPALREALAGLSAATPSVPLVSTVTGAAAGAELGDPAHWVSQLRRPVLFSAALRAAVEGPSVLVEIGPGATLAGLARRHALPDLRAAVVTLDAEEPEPVTVRQALGQLWANGAAVDPAVLARPGRRRVHAPGYAFRRRRLWIDPPASPLPADGGVGPDEPLQLPVWTQVAPLPPAPPPGGWRVDGTGALADALRSALEGGPADADPAGVIVVRDRAGAEAAAAVLDLGATVRDVAPGAPDPALLLVTRAAVSVAGDPAPDPAGAALRVLPRVLGQERPGLRWATVDLGASGAGDLGTSGAGDLGTSGAVEAAAAAVLAEAAALGAGAEAAGTEVALRGRTRWQCQLTAWRPPSGEPAPGAVLLIGGLGAVGRLLARHLAAAGHRVVVTTRGRADTDVARVAGVEVRTVDAGDVHATTALLRELSADGPLALVVHAAGVVDGARLDPLRALDAAQVRAHVEAKLGGALTLRTAIAALGPARRPRAVVVMSSATTLVGGLGMGAYAAANAAMDAVAAGTPGWCSAVWDGWSVGTETVARADALDAATGTAALDRLLSAGPLPTAVAVATTDLGPRVAAAGRPRPGGSPADGPGDDPAGELTGVQRSVAEIWSELFGRPVTGAQDDFFALGGHSLLGTRMLLALADRFGVQLRLRDLLAAPTVAGLASLLGDGAAPAGAEPAEAELPDVPAFDEDGTFAMTRVQHAYWVGRDGGYRWGDVPCHFFLEYDCPDLDLARYEDAWNAVVARHPMLRAVTTPGGRFRVLDPVPRYRIRTHDLRDAGEERRAQRLAAIRERVATKPGPPDRWPLVQIQAALLPSGRVRLFVGVDVLICDAASWWIIEAELKALYHGATLPGVGVHPAACTAAIEARRRGPAGQRAAAYWRARLDSLPGPPALPVREQPGRPRFVRRAVRIAHEDWAALLAAAARHRLTPTAVLLTVYADVLAAWSRTAGFAITLTLFDRPRVHPDVHRVVGDFTSLVLHEVPAAPAPGFAQRAAATQDRLFDDLDHREFSALDVLAEQAAGTGEVRSVPVVFTGALGVHDMLDDSGALEWVGEQVHAVGQTPQTWLDHQVLEQGGELRLQWDVLEGVLPDDELDAAVVDHAARVRDLARDPAAWTSGADPDPDPDPAPAPGPDPDAGPGPDPADVVLPLRAEPGSARPTLYLAHPSGGDVLCYAELSRLLDPRIDVAAIADPELAGAVARGPGSIPGIAAQYVRALERSGGRGPWLLGGWSMGGTVAQEMARRLHEAGERVPLLVMLDSNDPAHIRAVPGDDPAAVELGVALRHLHALEAFLGIDLDAGALPALAPADRAQAVADRLRAHRLLGRGEDVTGRLAVFDRHLRALAAHSPAPLVDPRTTTVLVRADRVSPRNSGIGMGVDDTPPDRQHDLGWGAHLAGPLHVAGVDAHHYGLLHHPALPTVAELINGAIRSLLS
jgi:acyl transferase domain-containing protein